MTHPAMQQRSRLTSVVSAGGLNPADRVGILGYGSQGRAQALNLRDSGVVVRIGLREDSASREQVLRDGLEACPLDTLAREMDWIVFLIPDEAQPEVYTGLEPSFKPGTAIVFAHGFNIHYRKIIPRDDLDVLLVAPLAVGEKVRALYESGGGPPCVIACDRDATGHAWVRVRRYAQALNRAPVRLFESSFAEETETDLFAEQAILCGGLNHLIAAGFETLVAAGYQPEIAYFSCLEEVKYMADLIYARGLAGMREAISTTAEYGDYTRGPRVIGEAVRAAMSDLLTEIRSGSFARELDAELQSGGKRLAGFRNRAREQAIETVRRGVISRTRETQDAMEPGGS
jgi:ketol-acid reductoisomerase